LRAGFGLRHRARKKKEGEGGWEDKENKKLYLITVLVH
jgi:hypothetical protein